MPRSQPMGHPRIQIIALVGAGAISSSAIFCFILMYFLPDPLLEGELTEEASAVTSGEGGGDVAVATLPEPSSFEATIVALRNSHLPLSARRAAAFSLAALGSDEALMELLLVASSASPFLKATIADALAEFDHADAHRFLTTLLDDSEEMVGRAAVRALGSRGDTEAMQGIAAVLIDAERPAWVRAEAALALGNSESPEATNLLLQATHASFDNEEMRPVYDHILDALARRLSGGDPVAWTRDSDYFLLSSDGDKKGGTAGFLVAFLADEDPDVRRTAARSLSTASNVNPVAAEILECLKREEDAEVRVDLYRALEGLGRIDCDSVLAVIREETHVSARMAGFSLLAAVVSNGASPGAIDFFDYEAVPELREAAVQGEDLQVRLSAVIALQRSRTSHSHKALREIAQLSSDHRVKEAALTATDFSRFAPFATVE
jgi:HEAT repeat protein